MPQGKSFVMADIPGLIEGAWEGVGLGHQFLRHVERCRLLIHVVDVAGSEGRDPKEDFAVINRELERFNPDLAQRPHAGGGQQVRFGHRGANRGLPGLCGGPGLHLLPPDGAHPGGGGPPAEQGAGGALQAAAHPPVRGRGPRPAAHRGAAAGPGGHPGAGRRVLCQGALAAEDPEHHQL